MFTLFLFDRAPEEEPVVDAVIDKTDEVDSGSADASTSGHLGNVEIMEGLNSPNNSDHEQEREPESPEVVSPPSTTRPSRKRRYVRKRTSSVKEKAKPKTSHCGKSKPNPDLVPVNVVKEGYDVVDEFVPNLPEFKPNRATGFHGEEAGPKPRENELDFFNLFLTNELIEDIAKHTNTYAYANILNKPSYAQKDGSWKATTPDEIRKLIALLIYQGMVKCPTFHRYWSTKSLYHGLWAREFLTRDRFKQLMGMLHVVDPGSENKVDKIRKVSPVIETFRERCRKLFQPFQNVAIDERIVKSKHRSGIRQYIKNKPVKLGLKLWVIADSQTGYTYDFTVYTGSKDRDPTAVVSEKGLGYDVVRSLCLTLEDQGYRAYFDNFYTSPVLVQDLLDSGIPSSGTTVENRRGFPVEMKGGKQWGSKKERGEMRWSRSNKILTQQWKDTKVVTMISSIENANEKVTVTRKLKGKDGKLAKKAVFQPMSVARYNTYMNGVDKSDQLLSKYNLLRKCLRWWKTLFFHLIDISLINGCILFQQESKSSPENKSLQRSRYYSFLDFREQVVRQLAGIPEYSNPPVYKPFDNLGEFDCGHLVQFSDEKRNCKVCYKKFKKELKVTSYCPAPQCQVYLHCTKDKNCFATWHNKNYHK